MCLVIIGIDNDIQGSVARYGYTCEKGNEKRMYDSCVFGKQKKLT